MPMILGCLETLHWASSSLQAALAFGLRGRRRPRRCLSAPAPSLLLWRPLAPSVVLSSLGESEELGESLITAALSAITLLNPLSHLVSHSHSARVEKAL